MYFEKFPKIDYEVKGDGVNYKMTDITRRVRFFNSKILDSVSFDYYDVKSGQTPEMIANEIYDDPNLHWVVLIANNITDVYTQWPMSVQQFENFVKDKYTNPAGIHHYEIFQTSGDTTLKIELPNESATTIPNDAVAVSNYQYEESVQDAKRKIRLIRSQHITQIEQEFERIITI